nr:MAG TPA: hypothetical protein [Caudoviricetes sp.]
MPLFFISIFIFSCNMLYTPHKLIVYLYYKLTVNKNQ